MMFGVFAALSRPVMIGASAWRLAAPGSCSLAAAAAARWRQAQQAAPSSSAAVQQGPRVSFLVDMHGGGPYGSEGQQVSPLQVLAPGFRDCGGMAAFSGQVSTVKCLESNVLVHAAVKEEGAGRVLVVDNGGSMRAAVLGDILAGLACKHGWAGIVVNGCIRDGSTVRTIPIGVKALDLHPMKPGKGPGGVRDVPVVVGGATIRPGDWLYADEDGILVSPTPLAMPDSEQLQQMQSMYTQQQ